MDYQKISVDLVVFSEDTKAVISELNSAIDKLEKTHTIFDGEIGTVAVEHSGTRRKSVLMHTLDAGNTVKLP